MILGQITDLHIKAGGKKSYRFVDTAESMRRCVEHIGMLKLQPDAIVVTGDLVDFGKAEEYDFLKTLLAPLKMPLYLIPGNHDERATMRAAFPDHSYLQTGTERIEYVIDAHPLRIVALDTVIPKESGGELAPQSIAWLDKVLSEAPAKPTVIVMHHPPFKTRISPMDDVSVADAAPLAAVVARHPQVERILCGHVHRSIQTRFAGTIASTCPSPAHQVDLDLRPKAPLRFVMEPPGYQLHIWSPGAGVVSHTVPVGNFGEPHPFYEGDNLID